MNAVAQNIALPGAELVLWPRWLDSTEADALLATLLEMLPWENHRIRMFGREVASPRLSLWMGDTEAVYQYSRTRFEPRPWPEVLWPLRLRVQATCGVCFNSVLANLYRDGGDYMGWHSDDEPELGAHPVIASLSLGATRRFLLRRRREPGTKCRTDESLELGLEHGSLLVMAGDTQRCYQHALPRMRGVTAARINLTFRWVARPA